MVIGPSGSGKSTLLRTINGLEMITSGNLLINDQDIRSKKNQINRNKKEYWHGFSTL